MSERQKTFYQKSKREGKCPACGGLSLGRKVFCQACLDKKKRNRELRRIVGQCQNCSSRCLYYRSRQRPLCQDCYFRRRITCVVHRARPFKFSSFEKDKMLKALREFDGKCQCCGSLRAGGIGEFHIDHKEAQFRGLLCHNCNVALGMVEDSEEKILLLLSYLRRAPKPEVKYDSN